MKVTHNKVVNTDTTVQISREDLINALNASGKLHIPYSARVWIDCERRDQFDLQDEGFLNIHYKMTDDEPEEYEEKIPF